MRTNNDIIEEGGLGIFSVKLIFVFLTHNQSYQCIVEVKEVETKRLLGRESNCRVNSAA